MQLSSQTRAVITGASRGIGAALAQGLAERGVTVGLVARNAAELETLAAALPGEGHAALPADVTDRDALAAAILGFEPVDLLIVNAGIAHYGDFRDLAPEDEDQMTQINWSGTLNTVRAALPGMVGRGSGHIVVISSGAGHRTFPGAAVYGATKSAQRGFSEGLRHELHDTGVSVTTVYPGEIKSHLHDHDHAGGKMPAWYSKDAADPKDLVAAIIKGVEADKRGVYYPPIVKLLRIVHGISPRAGDAMLRRLRGPTAAPRRG